MDVGIRSPFLDFFLRGEVARDVRMLAPRGALPPRAHEQIALLVMLTEDGDSEVRGTAEATLAQIPNASLAAFLGRSDAPEALRGFFRGRGIEPDRAAAIESDEPLVDADNADGGHEVSAEAELTEHGETGDEVTRGEVTEGEVAEDEAEASRQSATQRLGLLNVAERMKCAMKGTKEERSVLIRDPNKLVSVSVLSSPKVTDSEGENFAKMGNVAEEVLRIIGMNRGWTKNYGVVAALTRNPKTPLGISMKFVQRLTPRDLKMIALDRNLQEPLKQLVRKRLQSGEKK